MEPSCSCVRSVVSAEIPSLSDFHHIVKMPWQVSADVGSIPSYVANSHCDLGQVTDLFFFAPELNQKR